MTKLLSVLALAAFLILGGISSASAHCGACGESHAASGEMKPCTKCMKADKPCKCGKKAMKPCEKMLHGKEKATCKKCEESERKTLRASDMETGASVRSNIGSLKMKSRGSVNTGFNN